MPLLAMGKSTMPFHSLSEFLLLVSILFLIYRCPYNKVEESFNTQAVYDLQNYRWWSKSDLAQFDHIEFPGVVPRTFIGPLFLSIVSWPFTMISRLYFGAPCFVDQIIIRSVLGLWLWWCFVQYTRSVTFRFSNKHHGIWYADVGSLVCLLTALQFHLPFYMSRALPNTFALSICLLGYSKWIRGFPIACLCLIGACAVIFRCDLLVLVAPLYLQMLLFGEISFPHSVIIGLIAFVVAFTLTVCVDTYFWAPYYENTVLASPLFQIMKGWVWPEGMVLHFNTIANRSSEWGTQSWHWYFSNALPRALNSSLILLLVGLIGLKQPDEGDSVLEVLKSSCVYLTTNSKQQNGFEKQKELIYYIMPAFVFVGLYSNLPHKELRFIFPAIPLFTLGAAVCLQRMLIISNSCDDEDATNVKQTERKRYHNVANVHLKKKVNSRSTFAHWLLGNVCSGGSYLMILLALGAYNVFLLAAQHNYPGGVALHWLTSNLNRIENEPISSSFGSLSTSHVHIDVEACMTGVSRFGQESVVSNHHITYSKEEGLPLAKSSYATFDWLITSKNRDKDDASFLSDFEIIHHVNGFSGLSFAPTLHNIIGFPAASHNECFTQEWSLLPPYSFPMCARVEPSLYILRKIVDTKGEICIEKL